MTGCDNFCTYCAVPYTRGREASRPEEDILAEVKGLVEKGYKEITLLGQNVNSYGINNKFQITNNKQKPNGKNQNSNDFVKLLEKIDAIPGDYWVRFYSNHPKDFSDELIDFLAQSKHFCHYIHLPLQSGDDEIIGKMNRHYTAKQYLDLVKRIRAKIPGVTLTTDIIVGFPGETEKQFQNTVKVLEKVGFDMIFISEYSPRSGTPAAKMEDDVPHQEKGRRKKYLNDVVLANSVLKHNKKLVGKKVRVLVKGEKKGKPIGSTAGLKDVWISHMSDSWDVPGVGHMGRFANVKITKATSWGMEGVLVES
jgi:tRNA-2-methylthio-N6-dimethylallyladenosine synthase